MFFSFRKIALSFVCCLSFVSAQDQALKDAYMGMQGLMQAGQDPALLAQLMQDMQNPEMMAAAKKMMDDPEFHKQMKKLTESKDFKESVKKTQDMLNDPNTAAHAEAKMEHMLKVGQQQLKNNAAGAMEQAMAAMANPEVMAEMTKMLKDPSFKQQLEAMSKDPQFQNYVSAMQDMMKDPATKRKIEAVTEAVRASL